MEKITDVKQYFKNPRKIEEKTFNKLSESLSELGDLSGVVVDINSGEAIGGNQRTRFFQKNADKFVLEIHERFDSPREDGTVAYGYVVKDKGQPTEQKFSYREVSWDEKTREKANIQANRLGGFFDYDILGNEFEAEDLLDWGFSEFDLDLAPKGGRGEKDEDELKDSMGSYLEGNVKQIVLYFKGEEYDALMPRVTKIMDAEGFDNHTELFLKAFEEYESNRTQEKGD